MPHSPQAIVLFPGGMIKDPSGVWRTTTFEDPGDKYGALGDRLRVLAGNHLYQDNPELMVIVMGGTAQLSDVPDAPTVSDVMRRELEKLGVPEEKILIEEHTSATYDSLLALKDMLANEELTNVVFISNRYHLPRIKAMIEHNLELNSAFSALEITFMDAEQILIDHDPEVWQDHIAQVYQSEAMKKRIALEEKGIADLKAGTYEFRRYEPKS